MIMQPFNWGPDPDEQRMINSGELARDELAYWRTVKTAFQSKLLSSPPEVTALGCRIAEDWTRQDRKRDYRVLPLGKRHSYEYAHVAAFMLSSYSAKPSAGTEVSHLCHHEDCILGDHLWPETKDENLDRNKCQGWTWIRCPFGHLFNPCQHQPQCILPLPD